MLERLKVGLAQVVAALPSDQIVPCLGPEVPRMRSQSCSICIFEMCLQPPLPMLLLSMWQRVNSAIDSVGCSTAHATGASTPVVQCRCGLCDELHTEE
jgi:hypothetical protein